MSALLGAITTVGERLDQRRLRDGLRSADCAGARILTGERGSRCLREASEDATAGCSFVFATTEQQLRAGLVVYAALDGVLYNSDEIAAVCGEPSSSGQQQSLLLAYRRWGSNCFYHLRGSFACALLDLEENRLLLARDHTGSRPLYYCFARGFYFGSTVRALLRLSGLPARANGSALRKWLLDAAAPDASESFFEGVAQLPPASLLELELDQRQAPSVRQYWPTGEWNVAAISSDEAGARLRAMLEVTVEARTRGTSCAGITLSGGLDSSAMVGALRGAKGVDYPIHTFTFVSGARGSQAEQSRAEQVARLCGTLQHRVEYDGRCIPGECDALLEGLEQPVASPVLFAHRQLYRAAASAGVTTLLHGQGCDSLFAGARSHRVIRAASLWRCGGLVRACLLLARTRGEGGRARLFRSLAGELLPACVRSALRPATVPDWLDAQWFGSHNEAGSADDAGHTDSLRQTLLGELLGDPAPRMLHYELCAAQAYGITSSSPFLAPEMIEFVLSLPEQMLIADDGTAKYILRLAFRQSLPDSVLDNHARLGFPVPAEAWLRELDWWADQQLAEASDVPFLAPLPLRALWESFRQEREPSWPKAMQLWKTLLLLRWVRLFRIGF